MARRPGPVKRRSVTRQRVPERDQRRDGKLIERGGPAALAFSMPVTGTSAYAPATAIAFIGGRCCERICRDVVIP